LKPTSISFYVFSDHNLEKRIDVIIPGRALAKTANLWSRLGPNMEEVTWESINTE
jgi:hypothetical protein